MTVGNTYPRFRLQARNVTASRAAGFQTPVRVPGSMDLYDVHVSARSPTGRIELNDNFVIRFCYLQMTP